MPGTVGPLSILDMAVLMGVTQGKTDDKIANDLEISADTAGAVRQELLLKYGVADSRQLVAAALEHGPISWSPSSDDVLQAKAG